MPYANPEDRKAQQRRYYLANKAKTIAKAKAWAEAHPERAKELARESYHRNAEKNAAYRAANSDQIVERVSVWQEANAEKVRGYKAKYQREHKIWHRERQSRRRAQKLGQFIENVNPDVVYEMHGGCCGICGEFIDGAFHVDHVKPLARGGMHGYINVQPAHPVCNARKGAKELV